MLQEKTKLFSEEYKKTIKDALNVLDKKNLALIVQGVSFPSKKDENTGFGTYNSDGAKELFNFAKGVFSAIQLGPNGKTKLSDSSPYTGTVFSKNPLFINLKELTTDKWDKILSTKTLEKIVEILIKIQIKQLMFMLMKALTLLQMNFIKILKSMLQKILKKNLKNLKKKMPFG